MRHARRRTARCPGVLAAAPTILEPIIHHRRRDANTISRTAREMINWHPSQSGGFNRLTRLVAVHQYLIILNLLARVSFELCRDTYTHTYISELHGAASISPSGKVFWSSETTLEVFFS